MTIKLHCFGESGHSYKVALALEMTGTPWEPVFVDFFNGEARGPAFRKLNVMGECPVYVEGDEVLTQSGNILYHLVGKTGKLGGATEAEVKEVWRWVLWDNHKMSSQIGLLRFLMNFLPREKRPEGVIPFMTGRARAAFSVMEAQLTGKDWIAGGAGPTVADLSCASYLYYPEPFGFDRAEWPGIDAWLTRLSGQPGWKHPYDLMRRAFPPAPSAQS